MKGKIPLCTRNAGEIRFNGEVVIGMLERKPTWQVACILRDSLRKWLRKTSSDTKIYFEISYVTPRGMIDSGVTTTLGKAYELAEPLAREWAEALSRCPHLQKTEGDPVALLFYEVVP